MANKKKKKDKRSRGMHRSTVRTMTLVMRELCDCAQALEWSIAKWAAMAGVHQNTIHRLKAGDYNRGPALDTMVRVAHALHIDLVTAEGGSVELRIQGKPRIRTKITANGIEGFPKVKPPKLTTAAR